MRHCRVGTLRVMEYWTELRTAMMVASEGTVKGAAENLGVHRATVSRHIDTLEACLGAPLFQRHARGYALTETGRDMFEVTRRADEMFADLVGRSSVRKGQLSGTLIVTALAGVAPLVLPALQALSGAHPEIKLEFIAGAQLARLEYGEAHVAIRAGAKPNTPDYVVIPFQSIRFGLFASQSYLDEYGMPSGNQFDRHRFVGGIEPVLPYTSWIRANVPQSAFVLRTASQQVVNDSVAAGIGLGFMAKHDAQKNSGLTEVIPSQDDWFVALWLVTHVDLHRTLKVQRFLDLVRQPLSQSG